MLASSPSRRSGRRTELDSGQHFGKHAGIRPGLLIALTLACMLVFSGGWSLKTNTMPVPLLSDEIDPDFKQLPSEAISSTGNDLKDESGDDTDIDPLEALSESLTPNYLPSAFTANNTMGLFNGKGLKNPLLREAATALALRSKTAFVPLPPSKPLAKSKSKDFIRLKDRFAAYKGYTLQEKLVEVSPGDTLISLLQRSAGISGIEATIASNALSKVWKNTRLYPGRQFSLVMAQPKPDDPIQREQMAGMFFRLNAETDVVLYRTKDGTYQAASLQRPLTRRVAYAAEPYLRSTIYDAGHRVGAPHSVLKSMLRIFSYTIDFQRKMNRGDGFAVLYERFEDEDGKVVKTGDILYAKLTLKRKDYEIFKFDPIRGKADYFYRNGGYTKRSLLQTPVDGVRISSPFGYRRHPILGYNKLHKGIDFAAPTGTPIRAAGDGIIKTKGWVGGYGRYIRIRHNKTYDTAYAHMSRYNNSLKQGQRVRQGQIIGYVGSSGRSTGPHLHYEVLKNGVHINPKQTLSLGSNKLAGRDLRKFKEMVRVYDNRIREAKTQANGATQNSVLKDDKRYHASDTSVPIPLPVKKNIKP